MRCLRLMIGTLCLFLLVLSATAGAQERTPLRVARLPLAVESGSMPSRQILDRLERQIDRSLHVPLNGVLKAVEYIPEQECLEALDQVIRENSARPPRRKETAGILAGRLQADLVVLPVLDGYEQYTTFSWRWDRGEILHSFASVQITGYDRNKQESFQKSASRIYEDEYSAAGEVSVLAGQAMDEALREAKLRDRIQSWKEAKH